MTGITAIRANIAEQKTDAIVNAANTSLFGGTGVAGAIFDAAGYDQMSEACQAIGYCETGDAVITPGFKLNADYVIHAVGPVFGQNNGKDAELLSSCYWRSLQLAEENHLTSISFPLISTGIYGYPKEDAVKIAIESIYEYFEYTPDSLIEHIVICAYSDNDITILKKALQ